MLESLMYKAFKILYLLLRIVLCIPINAQNILPFLWWFLVVHWFRQILSDLSILVQDVDIERELHSLVMLRYDVAWVPLL